jgi:hypothetical protein
MFFVLLLSCNSLIVVLLLLSLVCVRYCLIIIIKYRRYTTFCLRKTLTVTCY